MNEFFQKDDGAPAATCHQFDFQAIGTFWQIASAEPLGPALQLAILDRVELFDAVYSRFRKDSLVARIASAVEGGEFDFPDDSMALFDLYDRMHVVTEGAVDPLIGRDLELWGYDRAYSLTPDRAAIAAYAGDRAVWSRDVQRQGGRLTTRRPIVIDVGAAGKGHLVDIVAELLRANGHETFLVDGSGDFRHCGPEPVAVGFEDPFDTGFAIGSVDLRNGALCASAVNRRTWGDFNHVVDARTGTPVADVRATWVLADTALLADALSTALFFADPDRLATHFDFSFVRVFSDRTAQVSTNFNGQLFS